MPDELVVVTGGAGFIGSNIVESLATEGRDVVVCDRFGNDERWRYLSGHLIHDIVQPESLLDWLAVNQSRVGAIVHMGAISATTEADVGKIVAENIRFTLDLWDFARYADLTFIYASSAATYGDGSDGFRDDNAPEALARLRPLNAYGWSKHFVDRRIIDDVIRGEATPRRWAGLKFFNVYGPNEAHKGSMRSVAHQIYPTALRGEPVRLFKSQNPAYPDGGQLRDFVYVKDCCQLVEKLLDADAVGSIYNCGTGNARSFDDLARAMFAAVGQEPLIEYVDMPAQLVGRYQYFTQADSDYLSHSPFSVDFHNLESGIADYTTYLAQEFQGA